MLYLLDANTLIDAKRDYYPIERIPEFWDWLIHQGEQDKVPDVCKTLGLKCINSFQMIRDLNFCTSWKTDLGG